MPPSTTRTWQKPPYDGTLGPMPALPILTVVLWADLRRNAFDQWCLA